MKSNISETIQSERAENELKGKYVIEFLVLRRSRNT